MLKTMLYVIVLGVFAGTFAVTRQISIEDVAELDARSGIFTVTKDIDVLPGVRLVIPAGATVHFMPSTGINVKGEMLVDGQHGRQVTLTSPKGAQGLGAPDDWRGIQVFPAAKVYISYTVISFASIGIRTCCDNVTIKHNVFWQNGINFQIGERSIDVRNREPVSYGTVHAPVNAGLGTGYGAVTENEKRYISPWTWVMSAGTVALAVAGSVYLYRWDAGVREYNAFGPDDPRFTDAYERERIFDEMRKRNARNARLGIGLTALGVGLGGYTVYYTWKVTF